jgi:2-polyprenyl-6-methoxyphenol hydroxylase-like FAD-dependent oxidoreductase
MTAMTEIDVLVVGAGPSGLTLASELRRHGASCRLIDQLAEPVTYSKAAVVHARTMEVFDAMGVAGRILDHSRTLHGSSMYAGGKRVVHVSFEGMIPSPYPHAYGISQHDTETVLGGHLARQGGAIERGVKLESFAQDSEGVTATLAHDGGKKEQVRARWLVGCDGAHSAVRKALGITFQGDPYEQSLIQTDARVEFARAVDDDEIVGFLHELGPAMFFPLFQDGRYRLILIDVGQASEAPAGLQPEQPTMEDFRRGLEARGIAATVSDPSWTVAFRIHHRHADRLRDGRVFIAGDAAHIHSPAGGQGMNTGIQDAFNLGWKLALVARGRGRPALLDSYEAERLPVIRALLAGTDQATRGMETAVKFRHPLTQGLRDQVMSTVTSLGAVQARAVQNLSMLGVGYADSPICAQDRPSVWQSKVLAGKDSEAPGVLDWAAFGSGPEPGQRAPDVAAEGGLGEGRPVRVHELVRAGKHLVLLFDGAAATEDGYRNLIEIAEALRARHGDAVAPTLVVPFADAPAAARWEGPTLLDPTSAVHQLYGARSECVYVIRPDGYIGYRGQPADGARLQAWFDRVLVGEPPLAARPG